MYSYYPRHRSHRGLPGISFGNSFRFGGRHNILGGYGSHSGYGADYGCQECVTMHGEHFCGCQFKEYTLELEYQQLQQSTAMGYGCECQYCPYEGYGQGIYEGGGGGGYPL